MSIQNFHKSVIGRCQLCGAGVNNGVDGCVDVFSEVCEKEYNNANYAKNHIITVDAHALQHPELHGALSNHYHLLSLHAIITRGAASGTGKHHSFLQDLMPIREQLEPLNPPPPLQRGALSIYDVYVVRTPDEHINKVEAWGQEVWKAWIQYHPWAEEMLLKLTPQIHLS